VNYEYDLKKAEEIISGSNWKPSTINSAINSAIAFTEKSFGTLHYNEADGRICNEWVLMKSDMRLAFKYKNMTNQGVIDIRACHPTFFSSYLMNPLLKLKKAREQGEEGMESSPSSSILHYVTHKGDKSSITHGYDTSKAQHEHTQWIELFTSDEIDARDVIAKECGYESRAVVKAALTETLNGSRQWKVLLRWIETRFPTLYGVWQSTNVKETGPNISKEFETAIINDPGLLQLAEKLNVKLAYEYDGFTVFAAKEEKSLGDKLKFLSRYIKHTSIARFGVPIVLKVTIR
jgi:hypothetical protein